MPGKAFIALIFSLAFFYPSPAWAYLDPGTGNMLIYIVISLVGAAAYFVKNIFYRLLKLFNAKDIPGADPGRIKEAEELVIFSEGKIYWTTFKPIVEALLELKRPFTYLTMDIEDPALTIENPGLDNRYVGQGSAGLARVCQSRARVMLATTPNIGVPGYPMPRPRQVKNLVHVFHGVGDVGSYRKFALDHYDTVLMQADYMLESIRLLEGKRGLTPKTCLAAGLPYLDDLVKQVRLKDRVSDPPVILAAPSWGERNFIGQYGLGPLESLVQAGYQLIVRPHPYSQIIEPQVMAEARERLAGRPGVSFDFEPDGSESFSRADLMIADLSGVRYDFALLYQRPVITIDLSAQDVEQYEMVDLDRVWDIDTAAELGLLIKPEQLPDLAGLVKQALAKKPEDLGAFRDRYLANFGRAGAFIADWLVQAAAGPETEPAKEAEDRG